MKESAQVSAVSAAASSVCNALAASYLPLIGRGTCFFTITEDDRCSAAVGKPQSGIKLEQSLILVNITWYKNKIVKFVEEDVLIAVIISDYI